MLYNYSVMQYICLRRISATTLQISDFLSTGLLRHTLQQIQQVLVLPQMSSLFARSQSSKVHQVQLSGMPPIPSVSSSIPFKATHIRRYKNLELVEMFEVKKRQAWAGVFPFFCSIPLSFCLSLQQGRQMRRIRANNGCQTQKPWIHTCICTGANHSFLIPQHLETSRMGCSMLQQLL